MKNAFLHGIFDETVYIPQPMASLGLARPHHVCHLKKAIYGLQQVPRA